MVAGLKMAARRDQNDSDEDEPPRKSIKFRNYQPKDEDLKTKKIEKTRPADVAEQVGEHLEKGKAEPIVQEVDITTLAPRKPDWDLKRDVAKKLEKLERRTQKAIVELIRERLLGSEENLATVVNSVGER